jgi:hypothetical protein
MLRLQIALPQAENTVATKIMLQSQSRTSRSKTKKPKKKKYGNEGTNKKSMR